MRSFSRGAAACGISQSAASQVVRHLEEELETDLIERKVRPPRPTPEGEIYYHGCQEILHRHQLVVEEMRGAREQVSGDFRVASIYSVGLHTLRGHIDRFLRSHPGTRIRLEYLHPDKVYTAVLEDAADIGVTSYPKPTRGLVVIPWVEEEMVLVCRPDHRLGKRLAASDGRTRMLHPSELDGAQLVGFTADLPIRREIDRALKPFVSGVELVSEFDNIETIKQAVELSASVSILPRPSVAGEVARGTLVAIPIDLQLRRPVGIIHRKKKRLTQSASRFVEMLLAQSPPKES